MPKDPCSYGTSGHPRRGNRGRPSSGRTVCRPNVWPAFCRLRRQNHASSGLCDTGSLTEDGQRPSQRSTLSRTPGSSPLCGEHSSYGMFAAQQQTPLLRFAFLNFSRPAGREPGLYRGLCPGQRPRSPTAFQEDGEAILRSWRPKTFVQYFLQNDFLDSLRASVPGRWLSFCPNPKPHRLSR